MTSVKILLSFCGACFALQAQLPAIYLHGVVNSASVLAPGLPAGSIAQGSIFTVFGSYMGPSTGVQVSSFPIANTLHGVSITVTQGSTSVNALPVYVQQNQINAIMPSDAPLGWVSLRVIYNNAYSNPSPVYVVHDSPGIYTFTGSGGGAAALQNIASTGALPLNSNQASAVAGQTVQLYLTGLGPITTPDNEPPPASSPTTPVEVWVGGIPATVSYSGRSPCCSGLDQIDFVVPASAPQGCWVPVQIRTSMANVSNGVSMAISANGGPCSDPENPLANSIVAGGAVGTLALTRTTVHQDVGVNNAIDVAGDTLSYSALKEPGGMFVSPPFLASPPPGTCTVYAGVSDYWTTSQVADTTGAATLDGGTQFSVAGPSSESVSLTGGSATLGSQLPLYELPNTLFLNPGNYTVSGAGGASIGAVKASVTVSNPLNWTNRDQTTTVIRTQPLTLNWSGGPAGQVITILGENSDLRTNSSALFYCVAPVGATSFTVPAQILEAIPPTRPNPLDSTSIVFLISSVPASFSATGLNAGVASAVYKAGKTVIFQ